MEVRPVIELVKAPVPVPSEVRLFRMVGLAVVDQQTPLAVIVPPPAEVTFPPPAAVVFVIVAGVVVVTVGVVTSVVNVRSLP